MSCFKSCCGFAHGQTSMYAMILGISSYLLAITSTWGCYFASVDFVFVDDTPTQYNFADRMGVGLFSYEDTVAASDLTCRMYSKDQLDSFDAGFKAARICGILANILIGSSMIFLICLSCAVVRKTTLRVVGVMLVLGGILEGLTFLLYISETLCESCEIFFGSGLALMCSIVTVVNGILTYRMPEVLYIDEDELYEYDDDGAMKDHEDLPTGNSDEDDVRSEYSGPYSITSPKIQIHEYNGQRQLVKTIVNQDGSRAVEETTMLSVEDLIGEEF